MIRSENVHESTHSWIQGAMCESFVFLKKRNNRMWRTNRADVMSETFFLCCVSGDVYWSKHANQLAPSQSTLYLKRRHFGSKTKQIVFPVYAEPANMTTSCWVSWTLLASGSYSWWQLAIRSILTYCSFKHTCQAYCSYQLHFFSLSGFERWTLYTQTKYQYVSQRSKKKTSGRM